MDNQTIAETCSELTKAYLDKCLSEHAFLSQEDFALDLFSTLRDSFLKKGVSLRLNHYSWIAPKQPKIQETCAMAAKNVAKGGNFYLTVEDYRLHPYYLVLFLGIKNNTFIC